MSFEIVRTDRGAPAMLDRSVGEVMHPVVGPVVEAASLYVGPSRLAERIAEPTVLFDVGLGAGSNAIAAWHISEARAEGPPLTIVSFDRTLDAMAVALDSEDAEAFGFEDDARDAGRRLLEAGVVKSRRTRWRVVVGELPDSLARVEDAADVVFWDPFSPRTNPRLWDVAAFRALRARCGSRATVHTYSGATATRSALLLAGFAVGVGVESGRGGTTEAAVEPCDLTDPLDERWLARLARSSAPFPEDAPEDALAICRARPQFASR